MNVYLIGMMGSGKSVTGKCLSGMLHWGFVDLDDVIREKARRTISQIFDEEGEHYFRECESEALREAAAVSGPHVVATGGGTVLRPDNVERMRRTGKVVYLETSPAVMWGRVREKKDRPLLKHPRPEERLREIYEVRRPLYEGDCDFRVRTDGETAEAVARKIFDWLEKEKTAA